MMYTKKQDKFAATFEEKTKECPFYARNMLALESMEFSRKEINMTKKYDEKEIRALFSLTPQRSYYTIEGTQLVLLLRRKREL